MNKRDKSVEEWLEVEERDISRLVSKPCMRVHDVDNLLVNELNLINGNTLLLLQRGLQIKRNDAKELYDFREQSSRVKNGGKRLEFNLSDSSSKHLRP